jgi:hypothetical protein
VISNPTVPPTETEESPVQPLVEGESSADNQADSTTNNQKGGDVTKEIVMFLKQFFIPDEEGELKAYYYSITGHLFKDAQEKMAYAESLATNEVRDGIYAVDQGSYRHRLLEEACRLHGVEFRTVTMESRDLSVVDYITRVEGTTCSWATNDKAFFMYIQPAGHEYHDKDVVITDPFGLESIGISLTYGKKLTKRMQEIHRSTEMSVFEPNSDKVLWTTMAALKKAGAHCYQEPGQIVFAEVPTPAELIKYYGEDAHKLLDGMNMVDADLMVRSLREQYKKGTDEKTIRHNKHIGRLIGKVKDQIADATEDNPFIDRYIFRVVGENMLKGDALGVVGLKARTGADVVYHTDNSKEEIETIEVNDVDAYTVITFEHHYPVHSCTIDQQTDTNLGDGIELKTVNWAMASLAEQARDRFAKGAPDWMKFKPQDYNDNYGVDTARAAWEDNLIDALRWQSYHPAFESKMWQNHEYMYCRAITDKMLTGVIDDESHPGYGMNTKPWIPAPNAVAYGVVTNAALWYMAGFNAEAVDELVVVEHVGVVFPDERWIACYNLYGGYDQDDTVNFMETYIYCDDPAYLELLRADGIIDANWDVPTTKEEAVNGNLALSWRVPNGMGEYAIQKGNFGYLNKDPRAIGTINLAKLPRGQQHLLANSVVMGLRSDPDLEEWVNNPGPYNIEQAKYILEAQSANPNFGPYANALMVWANAIGIQYPRFLRDKLENMVDAVMAGHDKVQHAQVKEAVNQILIQLAREIRLDPTITTDRLLVVGRLGKNRKKYMNVLRGVMVDKRPATISGHYMELHQSITTMIKNTLLQERAKTWLANAIRPMKFSVDIQRWASGFARRYYKDMARLDAVYRAKHNDPTFLKMWKITAKKAASKALIAKAVDELLRDESKVDLRVVAVYQYILKGAEWAPNGFYDRVMAQSAGNEIGIFDIFAKTVLKFAPK